MWKALNHPVIDFAERCPRTTTIPDGILPPGYHMTHSGRRGDGSFLRPVIRYKGELVAAPDGYLTFSETMSYIIRRQNRN